MDFSHTVRTSWQNLVTMETNNSSNISYRKNRIKRLPRFNRPTWPTTLLNKLRVLITWPSFKAVGVDNFLLLILHRIFHPSVESLLTNLMIFFDKPSLNFFVQSTHWLSQSKSYRKNSYPEATPFPKWMPAERLLRTKPSRSTAAILSNQKDSYTQSAPFC